MAPPSSVDLRHGLVQRLVAAGSLRTGTVQAAFGAVPRERFVPLLAATRGLAAVYADDALVIQERDGLPTSSSSQPTIMALMLEALDVRPGHRVLEVGLGTGYNAALLATLVAPDGAVTSVDIDETLVATATRTLTNGGYAVSTVTTDGRTGWPAGAPYDRLVATASGTQVHRAWWEQLAPEGRLVAPLRIGGLQIVAALARTGTGFRSTELIWGGFMPLRGSPDAPAAVEPTMKLRLALPGQPAVDRTVTGPGLAALSAKDRRTLAGNLLARPTRRTAGEVPAAAVVWHAALTTDPRRHLLVYEPGGIGTGLGLADAAGGCAVLAEGCDGRDASPPVVVSFGPAATARAALLERVRAWRGAGSPPFARLAVEVSYGEADPPGWALHTQVDGDQRLSIGWRP